MRCEDYTIISVSSESETLLKKKGVKFWEN